jgi:hypothetical protein
MLLEISFSCVWIRILRNRAIGSNVPFIGNALFIPRSIRNIRTASIAKQAIINKFGIGSLNRLLFDL